MSTETTVRAKSMIEANASKASKRKMQRFSYFIVNWVNGITDVKSDSTRFYF